MVDESGLGPFIRKRLQAIKKTPATLAREIGVSRQAVNKWLNGGDIKDEYREKVAVALDLPLGRLLRFKYPVEAMGKFAVAEGPGDSLFLSPDEARMLKQYRTLPPSAQLHVAWLVTCCAALGNDAYRDWETQIAAFNKARDKTKSKA